ncbi:low temperature requirement protein A [Streptomyces sp. NPDC059906]|uniref:low temperature requirement protein A n=1 Tax=Streptomyces sp. NPDC059906 TaxID=3346997 RepID=UPI003656D338
MLPLRSRPAAPKHSTRPGLNCSSISWLWRVSSSSRTCCITAGMVAMASSVSGIRGDRAAVFVVGYVALRFFAGLVWQHGKVVMDWPLSQMAVGALPWLVSLWVAAPTRYWLWAAGIALDVLVLFTASGAHALERARKRLNEAVHHGRRAARLPTLEPAYANVPHLAERLGLYVIIVLGEGVIQLVSSTADAHWDLSVVAVAVGAFTLLVALWVLSLLHGFAGVPRLTATALPTRFVMLLHCLVTAVLAALAAGLGAAIEHAQDHVPPGVRWLLCGSIAAFFAISFIAGMAARRSLLIAGVPALVAPLLLGLLGTGLNVGWFVWILTLVVVGQAASTLVARS